MNLLEFIEKFDELVTPELWEQCLKEDDEREEKRKQGDSSSAAGISITNSAIY